MLMNYPYLKMILFRLITYNNSSDNNILMLTKYKIPQRLIPRPPSDHRSLCKKK